MKRPCRGKEPLTDVKTTEQGKEVEEGGYWKPSFKVSEALEISSRQLDKETRVLE